MGVSAVTHTVVREGIRYEPPQTLGMKTRRSGTVAVVVGSLSNPLYPMLLQLLVERLASEGLRTAVWELNGAMDDVHCLRTGGESVKSNWPAVTAV